MIIYKIKIFNKQILAILLLNLIFLISLSIEYSKYLDLTSEEIYETEVEVLNIYEKTTNGELEFRSKLDSKSMINIISNMINSQEALHDRFCFVPEIINQ